MPGQGSVKAVGQILTEHDCLLLHAAVMFCVRSREHGVLEIWEFPDPQAELDETPYFIKSFQNYIS